MHILISIFAFYAIGILSYECGCFGYYLAVSATILVYNAFNTKRFLYSLSIAAFVFLSFINSYYNSIFVLKQYINEEIDLVVEISHKNKQKSDSEYVSYNARVLSINNYKLKEEENTIIYVKEENEVKENSVAQFTGRIADNRFSKNRMMFNYDNYLKSKKIGAVVFLKGDANTLKEDVSWFRDLSVDFKNYTENTFYDKLDKENADIILSIILGNSDYLDESTYDGIKEMGLAHIFAVSGTHIALMYVFLITLFRHFLNYRLSWVLTWVLIWLYGFLIGFPVTVLRALVMFTVLFGAEMFYRKYNSLNSIGLAALILTLYNPFWITDAGFLLSFMAALSLIFYNRYILKYVLYKNIILKSISLYLFLQLFTLPVVAYYFNYLPLMGIFYNLVLIHIFLIIIIFGFIILLTNGFLSNFLSIPFKIFDYLLYCLKYIISLADNIAYNGVIIPTMSVCEIIFFYIVLAAILYFLSCNNFRIKKCVINILLSFCILDFIIIPFMDNKLYFNVVDANQGLFTTVKYKNVNLIFDCGSNKSGFGEYTAVPYLTKHGIRTIDGVFISHWDEDHYSGLKEIINNNIKIKKIFSSFDNDEYKVNILKKENFSNIDERLKIEILWPDKNYIGKSTNNGSMVILMSFDDIKIFMAGDIEKEAEDMLLGLEHADILIVPHHGSKTSSTDSFVNMLKPDLAVISYGNNNYGMPSEEVISRYERNKSTILTTYNEGEINFILNDGEIYYNTYTGQKSDNFYKLYFTGLIPNLINFCLLLYCILCKGERYEL